MEYIAEYADKLGKGPSGNLYTGAADEKALVRAVSNKVYTALFLFLSQSALAQFFVPDFSWQFSSR